MRSCSLTYVQLELCSSSPPDSEGHGGVSTLHQGLQPLPALLGATEPLTPGPPEVSVCVPYLCSETWKYGGFLEPSPGFESECGRFLLSRAKRCGGDLNTRVALNRKQEEQKHSQRGEEITIVIMLILLAGIFVLHIIGIILLLVATIDNAWWMTETVSTDVWARWILHNGVWNYTALPTGSHYPEDYLQAVQASSVLACLCIMIAASIYTDRFHLDESAGWYGHCYILAWISFAITFISSIIYFVLRKKTALRWTETDGVCDCDGDEEGEGREWRWNGDAGAGREGGGGKEWEWGRGREWEYLSLAPEAGDPAVGGS
ncbi:hypothetical protein FQN60_003513 [Etheostoma spectabile]|uniref:Epithelial membrane protein 2 n=1 Tax=Etheostoma spectabile TaxID=54343 RepID=A0A5J5CUP8_9PERO|nr:hypothetical protein FQN60_003513 [Etheostoma spectabile]